MNSAMTDTVVDSIEFIKNRVEKGWNAKNDHERNFEFSQAHRMLEELSLAIRCEKTRNEEMVAKIKVNK